LPFLPASAVSSAADGSEDPSVRRLAGLLHPAAGRGVHHVSDSLLGLSAPRRPGGRGPEGPENLPQWRRPYEAFPSSAAWPCRHRSSRFRARLRSPAGVPSRRSTWIRSRVATPRLPPRRPQGLFPPRSPLRPRSLSASHRSMLPWALDRHAFRCCRAVAPPRRFRVDVSPRGSNRFGVLDPKSRRRQGVSALSGSSEGARLRPEGRGSRRRSLPTRRLVRVRCHPIRSEEKTESRRVRLRCVPEGSISATSHSGPRKAHMRCQWIRPEGGSHRVDPHTRRRTGFDESHPLSERGGLDPARAPKNRAGGSSSAFPSFRGCPRT
jgi:hypothetical protein